MAEIQYESIKAEQPKYLQRNLIRISGDRNLTASLEAFGPELFNLNITEMQKQYLHPQTREIITLREPSTAESILVASYDFTRAKPQIFHTKQWLQLGRILRTPEGVFANVPRDAQGDPITDEQTLKSLLKADKKVNGIWLLDNDFGYAPYETFKTGVQDAGDFVEGGLARILEHSQSPEKLKQISSRKNYPIGIDVYEFIKINKPILEFACLGSGWVGGWQLVVDGDDWFDYDGLAFGVLDTRKKIQDEC